MKKIFLLAFLIFIGSSLYSQIPNPPTLISPLNGATNISLFPTFQWQASSGATSYRLQISNGPTTVFDQSGITGTSFVLTAAVLTGYTSYTWRMNATNSSGTSSWSASWNFTTGISTPTAPILMIPPNGAVGVSIHPTLDWSSVPGATGYILHISKSPLFDSLVVCDTTPLGTITLQYNTLYYWRVCAMNSIGIGPWSSVWHFTTTGQIPDPPTLILPPDSSIISVTGQAFDWSDVPTTTSYRIQISTSSNFGTTFLNTVTTSSQYTHSTPVFSFSTKYYWRVNATNASGTSQWSSVWRFITVQVTLPPPSLIYPPNNYINVSLTPTLDWTDVPGATSYRVVITGVLDTIVTASEYLVPLGKLNYYTIYYWRVAAINNGGQSTWSGLYNFRTINSIGINLISSEIPAEYKLYNNYPNPFNPNTIIRFQIKDLRLVTLKVFNTLGKEVVTLVNENLSPGKYEVSFDGSNLPSGIYFYTIRSGDFTDTKRMLLIK
ncbi:MAG: T9SS type A sorting domain-containing protein [Ignavibacteriae bacterium]|nr:T9SS type A sorting domain-containing protein [Ignavibacteriota bacterium]